jgi:unsaturated chondroitin disaccharide hydrolase
MRGLRRAGVPLLAAVAVAWAVTSCGGSVMAGASVAPSGPERIARSLAGVEITPRMQVPAGGLTGIASPGEGPAVISFDAYVPKNSALVLNAGGGRIPLAPARPEPNALVLSRGSGFAVSVSAGGSPLRTVPTGPGWLTRAGWRHVEISDGSVSVDGHSFSWPRARQDKILIAAAGRHGARISALITSLASDPGALLFHRLAELHARVPAGVFPTGATLGDRLYYGPGWTSGFYAGALWQAAALEPAGGMFARWALAETIEHFGSERAPTHDVGFMYGQSSLNAWEALCGAGVAPGAGVARRSRGSSSLCARLRSSVVSAADELLALAGTNPVAGTIPTDPTSRQAETIVDSMMNIAILPWATTFTGNQAYVRLARHQASVIARVLVRANGSTAQSANFDRRTGRLISVTTHQGLSKTSTWARGEGWAVYGFAVAASEMHSRAFLRVAERVAGYVASHLPAGGVPRWDYDAPVGAPVDVSAGVITAAGLLHLAAACPALDGTAACAAPAAGWTALARRMLAAAVGGYASQRPPLGLLRSQIEDEHFRGCWCNRGELIYGISYALEGLKLLHAGL